MDSSVTPCKEVDYGCSAGSVMEADLQAPHGGKLSDLFVPEDQKAAVISGADKTIELSDRNACDVELLIVGWEALFFLMNFFFECSWEWLCILYSTASYCCSYQDSAGKQHVTQDLHFWLQWVFSS